MRNAIKLSFSLFLIISTLPAFAGRPKIKFGEVSTEDFSPKFYSIDSNANAVVLAHFGEAFYEGDAKGGFSVIYKKHLRIRLMNRNGFDAATISIGLYQGNSSMEERIEKLEAYTFNLENGAVEKTKLDNNSIFKDKVNKNILVKKFTMPNLHEGSIIDIAYTVKSPFERSIDAWSFQREYPVLWSEFKVGVPQLYKFVTLAQGYHPFAIEEMTTDRGSFFILVPGETASDRSETIRYDGTVYTSIWAMENVPAIKPESFTTTLDNHIAKVSFQLSKIQYPNSPVKDVMNNWFKVADELMKSPDFGEEISGSLSWLKSELKTITQGQTSEYDASKRIYEYVRNNFTCSNHQGVYKTNSLKKIFQSKSGSVAELNLLLTAMLTAQGLDAHPVVLSTRDNGIMSETYPIQDRMNYVICRATVDGKYYLLDGSYPKLGFGQLNDKCYNGTGRLIDKMPYLVNLSPDSVVESKTTTFFLLNTEDGKFEGNCTSFLGRSESYDLRESLVNGDIAEYAKTLKKGFSSDVTVSNVTIDSLKNYDEPAVVKYDMKFNLDEDIIYLNPLFNEAKKVNPFKAAERFYPVEMEHAFSEVIIVRMDIPKGYAVEEMPKSTRVKLNENEGIFEYLTSKQDDIIQLRSTVKLNKANFLPDDYQTLRDFFAYIVKKQGEQIVLKKIKK